MEGLIIGVITFLLIGLFHPIVIKAEFYFGMVANKYFIISGILFAILSLILQLLLLKIICGVIACCCFWSVKEMKEQQERVLKGWFPENPKRHQYYESIRKQNSFDSSCQ
ncbi:MAG: DUF4491 family protein [Tissierellia bacterium]|nr:DUF4491 family protein [Tissierellia bacterium]